MCQQLIIPDSQRKRLDVELPELMYNLRLYINAASPNDPDFVLLEDTFNTICLAYILKDGEETLSCKNAP